MDKQTITLAIAITGAVTGILGLVFNFLNTWRAFDRDQVKLKVIPKWSIFFHPALGSQDMLSVEVINTGFLPVTLSRVVFPANGTDHELHFQQSFQKVELPARLEPRESVTIYAPPDLPLSPEFSTVTAARAYTACGRKFDGTSPALETAVKRIRRQTSRSS